MIQLKDISLSFGQRAIFSSINALFHQNSKIGVVGRNGAGKSTLLNIIAGLSQPDSGSVSKERTKTVAYLPQDIVFESKKNVFDEVWSGNEDLVKLLEEKKILEQELETPSAPDATHVIEHYARVQEQLSFYNIPAHTKQTNEVLIGLGFNQKTMYSLVCELSAGWRMRVLLAKLLVKKADFYLFDEPTNHLDIISKEWFFDFLKTCDFGFLLVTHDRYFLEKACSQIFELEQAAGRLFNGSFSFYVNLKEQEAEIRQSTYERQMREVKVKQTTINRFRASATKAKMAQSMMKQLEKFEETIVKPEPILPTVTFKLPTPTRAGTKVLDFKNLSAHFEQKKVFEHISGEIQRMEKVAVIAPNGTGKTTLFNLLVQSARTPQKKDFFKLEEESTLQISPQASNQIADSHDKNYKEPKIIFGHHVSWAYFEQDHLNSLNPANTVFDEILHACPTTREVEIRTMLGSFLFIGDDIYKNISVLSGGERCRVALVKLLLQNANFLLLDEPTNHLDLYTKEIVLNALQAYQGTLFFVSHDHDFVQRLATRIFELTPTKLFAYDGDYESYLALKKNPQQNIQIPDRQVLLKSPEETLTPTNKTDYHTRKELASLERKIEKIERDLQALYLTLSSQIYGSESYQKTHDIVTKKERELKAFTQQWESFMSQIT